MNRNHYKLRLLLGALSKITDHDQALDLSNDEALPACEELVDNSLPIALALTRSLIPREHAEGSTAFRVLDHLLIVASKLTHRGIKTSRHMRECHEHLQAAYDLAGAIVEMTERVTERVIATRVNGQLVPVVRGGKFVKADEYYQGD